MISRTLQEAPQQELLPIASRGKNLRARHHRVQREVNQTKINQLRLILLFIQELCECWQKFCMLEWTQTGVVLAINQLFLRARPKPRSFSSSSRGPCGFFRKRDAK